MEWEYKPGNWWMICDRCGFKKRISECKKTWDNLWVCSDTCWEPRHPQEFVRGRRDRQSVPIARPESSDTFTDSITDTSNL